MERLTLATARAKLADVGLTLQKRDGEYRVAMRPLGYTRAYLADVEAGAYYTTDLQDALDTGLHIAAQGAKRAQ